MHAASLTASKFEVQTQLQVTSLLRKKLCLRKGLFFLKFKLENYFLEEEVAFFEKLWDPSLKIVRTANTGQRVQVGKSLFHSQFPLETF